MQEFSGLFDGVVDRRRSSATRRDFHEMLAIGLVAMISDDDNVLA